MRRAEARRAAELWLQHGIASRRQRLRPPVKTGRVARLGAAMGKHDQRQILCWSPPRQGQIGRDFHAVGRLVVKGLDRRDVGGADARVAIREEIGRFRLTIDNKERVAVGRPIDFDDRRHPVIAPRGKGDDLAGKGLDQAAPQLLVAFRKEAIFDRLKRGVDGSGKAVGGRIGEQPVGVEFGTRRRPTAIGNRDVMNLAGAGLAGADQHCVAIAAQRPDGGPVEGRDFGVGPLQPVVGAGIEPPFAGFLVIVSTCQRLSVRADDPIHRVDIADLDLPGRTGDKRDPEQCRNTLTAGKRVAGNDDGRLAIKDKAGGFPRHDVHRAIDIAEQPPPLPVLDVEIVQHKPLAARAGDADGVAGRRYRGQQMVGADPLQPAHLGAFCRSDRDKLCAGEFADLDFGVRFVAHDRRPPFAIGRDLDIADAGQLAISGQRRCRRCRLRAKQHCSHRRERQNHLHRQHVIPA